MKAHKWRLVFGVGEESESRDEIYWCEQCGTVRHDYRYSDGKTSPNYPLFYVPGIGATPNSSECSPAT